MRIQFEEQSLDVNTVFCVGRNYPQHIAELHNERPNEPLIFLKPNQCIQTQPCITLPAFSQTIHYECELVLLMGADSDDLKPQRALEMIAGYGIGLDLTARDVQEEIKQKGWPWTKAKAFKQAACLSSFLARKRFPETHLEFTLHVNQKLKQKGNTAEMIFSIPELLCYLAQHYGLRKGDLVFTGTPSGVGTLQSGDVLDLNLHGLLQSQFQVQ